MERVGTLINKLKEQFEQQADVQQLAYTAQLLLCELQQKQVPVASGSGISVVMPATSARMNMQQEQMDVPAEITNTNKPANGWLFEDNSELPTLAHQMELITKEFVQVEKPPKKAELNEVHELISAETESLNDKLKEEKKELAHLLQESPIRDLKKAIGLNDRFLFVNDLFRGDENMYERSLKTINAFTIYPEAEYWIQRELKVKLSWPDSSESVRLFDQLVKRRFASI